MELRQNQPGLKLKGVKIGVLGGGVSPEREISLLSARQAYQALQGEGLNAILVDISTADADEVKRQIGSGGIELAFIALHGEFGEDGRIQEILEELAIPYTGSKPAASLRTMDKILSKNIFIQAGIPTPAFKVIASGQKCQPESIRYPAVVKPYFSGSSLGVSIVKDKDAIEPAIERAFFYQNKIIIEDYIEGRELTVGILRERPLGVVEIIPGGEYFDFTAKYNDPRTKFIAPAELVADTYARVRQLSLEVYRVLGCRHFCRVDIRLGRNDTPYILEVNSIPGLTPHSLLPLSGKVSGLSYRDLILEMTEAALDEKKAEQKV